MFNKKLDEQIKLDIRNNFNLFRERYGDLLIKFYKEKINTEDWNKLIIDTFDEKDLSLLLGTNIQKFIGCNFNADIKNLEINLGKGSKLVLSKGSSRLLISPEKAAILTWICTDGYLEISKRGYYIRIRDEDKELLYHFIEFVRKVYGKVKSTITKIKNKNAHEARICSKEIVSDIVTYIPLSSTRKWSIPIEILDKESIKSVLRILTQTEGSIFSQNRTRMIEITLANLESLTQAKYLFEEIEIPTKGIRKDFSGGYERYKLGISTKDNLEKFGKIIGFIPKTKKYYKFKEIMNNYKEHHKLNAKEVIINILKNNSFLSTKEIVKISKLDRTTVSRNLKKLRGIEKIDYKKGKGKLKLWFTKY